MNVSASDAPQPGARSEGTVMRFLRWLIEPPVESQAREVLVLRWLLRAFVFLLFAFFATELSELTGFDVGTGSSTGMGGNGKPSKPPA